MTSGIYEGLERIPLPETDLEVRSTRKSVRKWPAMDSLGRRAAAAIVMAAAAGKRTTSQSVFPTKGKGF